MTAEWPVAGYLGYLSYQVFQDSLMFPLALSVLGLGVVVVISISSGAVQTRVYIS